MSRNSISSSKLISFSYERALSRHQREHAEEIAAGSSSPLTPRLSRTPGLVATPQELATRNLQYYYDSVAEKRNDNVRKKGASHVKFADSFTKEQKIQSFSSQIQQSIPSSSFSPSKVYDRSTITLEDILNSNLPSDSPPIVNATSGNNYITTYNEARVSPTSIHNVSKPSRQEESKDHNRVLHSTGDNTRQYGQGDDENLMMDSYDLDAVLLELSGPYEVNLDNI